MLVCMQNILFDSKDDDARIKITDFGLSKVFDKGGTTDGQDIGKDELAGQFALYGMMCVSCYVLCISPWPCMILILIPIT